MPLVAMVHGIAVRFYYDDHDPPHFHVKTARFEAKIDLGTLAVSESSGRLRANDLAPLLRWARQHQADLYRVWWCARNKQPLPKLGNTP